MHRSYLFLAVGVVAVVLALVFAGPALLEAWRGNDSETVESPPPEVAEVEEDVMDAETAAKVERVSGMLMLYQACANRFDGFDAEHRDTLQSWKARHAEVLERQGAEPDFHIVLAQPAETPATEKADAEERALCERNVEAMRAELSEAPARQ